MKTMTASELKAKCLGVLDDVARDGKPVLILKRGRPVAQLVAAPNVHPQHALRGSLTITGDVVAPVLPAEDWNAESPRGR